MVNQSYITDICSFPPALDDLILIAALDGDVDDNVLSHLRDCPHCAQRAQDFASLQRFLRQRLYRALCPSSDELLSYYQRTHTPEQMASMKGHLSICQHCTRELRLLERAAQVPNLVTFAPLIPLRQIIARLEVPRQLSPTALFGGLRGVSNSAQFVYRAENMQLMVSVERAVGRPGRMVLTGFLVVDNALSGHTIGSTASLLTHGDVVGSALIDDLGCFMIEDIVPGEHSLSLRLRDCEILVEALCL